MKTMEYREQEIDAARPGAGRQTTSPTHQAGSESRRGSIFTQRIKNRGEGTGRTLKMRFLLVESKARPPRKWMVHTSTRTAATTASPCTTPANGAARTPSPALPPAISSDLLELRWSPLTREDRLSCALQPPRRFSERNDRSIYRTPRGAQRDQKNVWLTRAPASLYHGANLDGFPNVVSNHAPIDGLYLPFSLSVSICLILSLSLSLELIYLWLSVWVQRRGGGSREKIENNVFHVPKHIYSYLKQRIKGGYERSKEGKNCCT